MVLGITAMVLYELAAVATFVKLTFFDDITYNWWNWIVLVPIHVAFGQIWPIYWLTMR